MVAGSTNPEWVNFCSFKIKSNLCRSMSLKRRLLMIFSWNSSRRRSKLADFVRSPICQIAIVSYSAGTTSSMDLMVLAARSSRLLAALAGHFVINTPARRKGMNKKRV